MRAVARLGEKRFPLYGRGPYEASRIDSFLDASLIFARDSQIYLLSLLDGTVNEAIHARTKEAFAIYAGGIECALLPRRSSLVGDDITLADICFATELVLFMNERQRVQQLNDRGLSKILHQNVHADYPLTMAHFARLAEHPNFKPDIEPYLRKLSAAAQGVSVKANG
jgi:elongation factor 1-gamma